MTLSLNRRGYEFWPREPLVHEGLGSLLSET